MKPVTLGALFLLALLALASKMDLEDAKAEQAAYCDMVAKGLWPAYEGTEQCQEMI